MSSILRHVGREPLIHFAFLAGILFAVEALWPRDRRDEVHIDRGTIDYLVEQQSDLLLRELTAEEQQAVVDRYVVEELLFREGRKRGLDDNSRVRSLIVKNMRFLLVGDPRQPDEEELRDFFDRNEDIFSRPATVTLGSIYFADGEAIPENLLARLRSGENPAGLRETTSAVISRVAAIDRGQLAEFFDTATADGIMTLPRDSWAGPIKSPQGTHYVFIEEKHPPQSPSFEDVSQSVQMEWNRAEQIRVLDREMDTFRDEYRIVIDPWQ